MKGMTLYNIHRLKGRPHHIIPAWVVAVPMLVWRSVLVIRVMVCMRQGGLVTVRRLVATVAAIALALMSVVMGRRWFIAGWLQISTGQSGYAS